VDEAPTHMALKDNQSLPPAQTIRSSDPMPVGFRFLRGTSGTFPNRQEAAGPDATVS